jgi:hypothetical protein
MDSDIMKPAGLCKNSEKMKSHVCQHNTTGFINKGNPLYYSVMITAVINNKQTHGKGEQTLLL